MDELDQFLGLLRNRHFVSFVETIKDDLRLKRQAKTTNEERLEYLIRDNQMDIFLFELQSFIKKQEKEF